MKTKVSTLKVLSVNAELIRTTDATIAKSKVLTRKDYIKMSDNELLTRSKNLHDEKATAAFVKRYESKLVCYVQSKTFLNRRLWIMSPDIVAEAIARLFTNLNTNENFCLKETVGPWLYTVIDNLIKDLGKKAEYSFVRLASEVKSDKNDDNKDKEVYEKKIDPTFDCMDIVLSNEILDNVHKAISTLPPCQAQTAIKYYLEGISTTDIAREEGLNINTVTSRLFHATPRLQEYLRFLRFA